MGHITDNKLQNDNNSHFSEDTIACSLEQHKNNKIQFIRDLLAPVYEIVMDLKHKASVEEFLKYDLSRWKVNMLDYSSDDVYRFLETYRSKQTVSILLSSFFQQRLPYETLKRHFDSDNKFTFAEKLAEYDNDNIYRFCHYYENIILATLPNNYFPLGVYEYLLDNTTNLEPIVDKIRLEELEMALDNLLVHYSYINIAHQTDVIQMADCSYITAVDPITKLDYRTFNHENTTKSVFFKSDLDTEIVAEITRCVVQYFDKVKSQKKQTIPIQAQKSVFRFLCDLNCIDDSLVELSGKFLHTLLSEFIKATMGLKNAESSDYYNRTVVFQDEKKTNLDDENKKWKKFCAFMNNVMCIPNLPPPKKELSNYLPDM